jgi:hypothetical protein
MTRRKIEPNEPATEAQKASFEAMLRERRPPSVHGTDSHTFRGKLNDPFPGMIGPMRQVYLNEAKRLGVSLAGKVYNHSLVRSEYQGRFDPQALIGSVSDAKAVIASHPEWSADGMVRQKGREPEVLDDQPYRVAEHLVEEDVIDDLETAGVDRIGVREFNDLKEAKRRQLEGAMNENTP